MTRSWQEALMISS